MNDVLIPLPPRSPHQNTTKTLRNKDNYAGNCGPYANYNARDRPLSLVSKVSYVRACMCVLRHVHSHFMPLKASSPTPTSEAQDIPEPESCKASYSPSTRNAATLFSGLCLLPSDASPGSVSQLQAPCRLCRGFKEGRGSFNWLVAVLLPFFEWGLHSVTEPSKYYIEAHRKSSQKHPA